MIALVTLVASILSMILFALKSFYIATFFGFIGALLVLYLIRHRLLELILFMLVSGWLEYWLVEKGINQVQLIGIGAGMASFVWVICKVIYHNFIEHHIRQK